MVPKGHLMESFIKDGIQHTNLWELLNFPQDWGLIPLLELENLLLIAHLGGDKKL
jgi:hypothetical protein